MHDSDNKMVNSQANTTKEKAIDSAGYKLFSKRWLEYAKGGWNKDNDLAM